MPRQKPIEFITPPNTLKVKVGGGLGGVDTIAIKKAQMALADLKEEFAEWIGEEVEALADARTALHKEGFGGDAAHELHTRAHDLKGLGTTYDFPLVSRLAANLSKLLEETASQQRIPLALIDSHVDGIRAMVRDSVKDPHNETGVKLCQELELVVEKLVKM